ncbi:MAG: flagellar biosynthesis protein FlhA [Tissierellia bacterium]|nr:flagellar biosynthesis protein FlhA [Tissierellia bacterium]
MKFSDIVVALGIITIVIIIVIPIPNALLDILLSINIAFSLLILLISMYAEDSLKISIFPSLLLVATLYRLSLSISTTRNILSKGDAGIVVETFGNFVTGDNIVVGFIIFLIISIIQFIVITKGAERVAEVSARFTLDAMPGKQMAIDADLNAGLITEQEAIERRKEVQRNADFYGAMDGASKFVKGDAIAGLIIIAIDIIGGIIIGVIMHGMPAVEALDKYVRLTVGDGLVSQIPALLISTATGLVVTRAASESSLGKDFVQQIFGNYPKLLYIVGGVIVFLGLVTPLPASKFLILGFLLVLVGYLMDKGHEEEIEESIEEISQAEELRKPENVYELLKVDDIEMEFGYGLIPLADVDQGGDLLDRIVMIRRQIAMELGFVVPTVRLRDNIQLNPNEYVIKIKGVRAAKGEVYFDHYLAMDPGTGEGEIEGIDTIEPAFGLPAKWITDKEREKAEIFGYTVVDPPSVIATHLTEVIKEYAHELIGRQDVKLLIDNIKNEFPAVVEELVPKILSLGEIQKVLSNLLKEQISIRDMVTILETLADYGRITHDTDLLTEYVRQRLSGYITNKYVEDGKQLNVVTLDNSIEEAIMNSINKTETGSYLSLEPSIAQRILNNTLKAVQKLTNIGAQPIVLTAPIVRLYFKRLTEQLTRDLIVLSYNEIDPSVEIKSIEVVSM